MTLHLLGKEETLRLLIRQDKRGKVYETTEKYSVLRAMKAIERSDVALILIDADTGIREQDKKIAGYAHDAGRAIVIVVNKWDTVESSQMLCTNSNKRSGNNFNF